MISDYFLKFSSKEEAIQVFSTIPEHTYTPYNPETNEPLNTIEITTQTETFAIDEVGVLYNNDGVYETNSETGEITVVTSPTQISGYHYNYRTVYGNKPPIPLPVELEPYQVTPPNPQRTFL
jgi:hypothetical protein